MNPIYIVTTNNGKFKEIKRWINKLDPSIEVEQKSFEIPEYQTLDINEVAIQKAKSAWSILQKPLLIDDGGLYLEQYNQFPGALTKYVYQGIGFEGLWKLAKENPKAYFLNVLVFINGQESYHIFQGIQLGTIIKLTKPLKNIDLPLTEIFVPKGKSTSLADLLEKEIDKEVNHRYKSISKFVSWFKKSKTNH